MSVKRHILISEEINYRHLSLAAFFFWTVVLFVCENFKNTQGESIYM